MAIWPIVGQTKWLTKQQDHPLAQNSKKRGSGRIIHCEKVKADKECTELFVISATVMSKTTNSTSAITLYSMYPYLHPLVGLIFTCIHKSYDFLCVSVWPPQFLSEVEAWCKICSEGGLPSEMQELEIAIHRHQSLYEQVTQAYTEVNQQHRTT